MNARIFRVTLEVSDLDKACEFYSRLLDDEGKRHPGSRHYYDCGGVILALLDVSASGMKPVTNPKSLYLAVDDIQDCHARAKAVEGLAPYKVHGQAAGEVTERPWGEVSFYVVDPFGNDLCFVEDGSLYT